MRRQSIHSARLATVVAVLIVAAIVAPAATAGQPKAPKGLWAELDGTPIALRDVSRYFCHDLDYPKITCSRSAERTDGQIDEALARAESEASLSSESTESLSSESGSDSAGMTYAVIYEHTSLAGNWMYLSQDYGALFFVGWNDRVSSFKSKNWGSGSFYVEWFGGGAHWDFCCNQQALSLGSFNDTFSSVYQ